MNKILITGAEGFIGSHLVEIALKKNYKVKASILYNFNGSLGWAEHLKGHRNLEIVFGDIRASDSAEMLVRGCNYIINLAALISIPYSYETPHSYLYNNVLGTLNLLTSARKNKIKNFIQASTSEVYGTAQYVPIDENHPLNPQSPYAASKVASDQFALSFYKSFDLPVNIIRPFNTFGPRQSLRAVIPTIIYQMIRNKGNINLGSLDPRRDFTYVTDTADGILKMLNLKKFGNVINLGMGVDYSIKEILEIIPK